jgi:hypothetical protein
LSRYTHLHIGSLLFEGIDQIDLTGPFEVLSRIPNATYRIYGKTAAPVRDLKGLWLTPDATLADAPPLHVLHVPGGFGQEALMDDAEVLGWIRQQAAGACSIFSVCTLFYSTALLVTPTRSSIGTISICFQKRILLEEICIPSDEPSKIGAADFIRAFLSCLQNLGFDILSLRKDLSADARCLDRVFRLYYWKYIGGHRGQLPGTRDQELPVSP